MSWPGRWLCCLALLASQLGVSLAADVLSATSLRGTRPDGAVAQRVDGGLRIDLPLRERFDYYQSLNGEVTPAVIRQLVVLDLSQSLSEPALAQALDLFDRYRGYAAAVAAMPRTPPETGQAGRLHVMRSLRAVYFSPQEVLAWFRVEDSSLFFGLARQALEQEADLGMEQKRERLRQLSSRLSPDHLRQRKAWLQHLALARAERRLLEDGAQPAAVARLRGLRVGSAAAGRLAQLEQERYAWQLQLAAYRKALRAMPGVASGQRDRRERLLCRSMFSEQECLRLVVLSRSPI